MKIAMVASEANPLAKSGGLADVVSALSVAYTKKGHEVIIVIKLPFDLRGRSVYFWMFLFIII